MKKTITCIICPRGCSVTVEKVSEHYEVSGNSCKRGEKYAIDEITNPLRTVTSVVRVSNRDNTMVSVKTLEPIPKGKIFEAMEIIRNTEIAAPVKIGDTVIDDLFDTKVIATKDIE